MVILRLPHHRRHLRWCWGRGRYYAGVQTCTGNTGIRPNQRCCVDDHLSPIIESVIVVNHVPFLLVEACIGVGMPGMCIRCVVGCDLCMAWESCRCPVTEVSKRRVGIEVAAKIGHALAREDAEHISLMVRKLCEAQLVSESRRCKVVR